MTAVGITVLVGLLTLCLGVALGATWTVQALDRQFRRLAIERQELNALRLALKQRSLRCPWCGYVIGSAGSSLPGGGGAIWDDHSHVEPSRAVGTRR